MSGRYEDFQILFCHAGDKLCYAGIVSYFSIQVCFQGTLLHIVWSRLVIACGMAIFFYKNEVKI